MFLLIRDVQVCGRLRPVRFKGWTREADVGCVCSPRVYDIEVRDGPAIQGDLDSGPAAAQFSGGREPRAASMEGAGRLAGLAWNLLSAVRGSGDRRMGRAGSHLAAPVFQAPKAAYLVREGRGGRWG